MAMNDTQTSTDAQSVEQPVAGALSGLADRLAQVLAFAGISQAELARRVQMSPGFISDVLRGVKRPGPELLLALRQELGVSIDWLLSGEGTMIGGSGIRHDLFVAIRLQVAVARAAVLDDQPVAQALLLLIREGRLDLASADPAFKGLLEQLLPADDDLDLVVQLYNGQQWATDPVSQRRNLLAAAEAHFQAKKPLDRLAAVSGLGAASGQPQTISGKGHRIAGRDYIDRRGRKS